jgi:hypothetical protein
MGIVPMALQFRIVLCNTTLLCSMAMNLGDAGKRVLPSMNVNPVEVAGGRALDRAHVRPPS